MTSNDTSFISFGHRCSASALLKLAGLSEEALPFDSIVSKLGVIRDCLESEFKEFLDPANYVYANTATVNILDGVAEEILPESLSVNTHYEEVIRPVSAENLAGSSTCHLQLAMNHHDLSSPGDHDAFTRRIRRLQRTRTSRMATLHLAATTNGKRRP